MAMDGPFNKAGETRARFPSDKLTEIPYDLYTDEDHLPAGIGDDLSRPRVELPGACLRNSGTRATTSRPALAKRLSS